MPYVENPKTAGSGIICCIPQEGPCPMNCPDCFFQSGRSYLEPLKDNLPNIPTVEDTQDRIVRVNDGNDSSNQRELVLLRTKFFRHKFYNTSVPGNLDRFDGPVVLTINPGILTDERFFRVDPLPNLMFVRFRINTWNLPLCDEAVAYYSMREIPVVLTFMAYYVSNIPFSHARNYELRKRTVNEYSAITRKAYKEIMNIYSDNKWVYSCSNESLESHCRWCGNCLREYFATIERMRNEKT